MVTATLFSIAASIAAGTTAATTTTTRADGLELRLASRDEFVQVLALHFREEGGEGFLVDFSTGGGDDLGHGGGIGGLVAAHLAQNVRSDVFHALTV